MVLPNIQLFIRLFFVYTNDAIQAGGEKISQYRYGLDKFKLLPWFEAEFGLIVRIDQIEGLQVCFITVLTHDALKAVNADAGLFNVRQFINISFRFPKCLQYTSVQAFRQQVKVGELIQEFMGAYLLVAAEGHTPWRKSEKYLSFRFQECF